MQVTDVPFFFISLSSERTELLTRSFANVTNHLEHVQAVRGNESARDFALSTQQYTHLLKRNTPSELGCALSHLLAIRRAEERTAATGAQMAVVMEDDVSSAIVPLWTRSLSDLVSSLPDNWAVVQLQLIAQRREWLDLRAAWRSSPAPAVLQDRRRHFGTGAYLIHRRGMRQLLSLFVTPAVPARASLLANTMGAPELTHLSPGSVRLPLSADEVQADLHLIYSIASPVYLATPPLLSCSHTSSSIEHHSAIRLLAQNAALENDVAHEVSEGQAISWAREAKETYEREAVKIKRGHGDGQALKAAGEQHDHEQTSASGMVLGRATPHATKARMQVATHSARVLPPPSWSHYYCQQLRLAGVSVTAGGQQSEQSELLHLLVSWMEGGEFKVLLEGLGHGSPSAGGGSTAVVEGGRTAILSVTFDASASNSYPLYTFRLLGRSARRISKHEGRISAEASDLDGEGGRGSVEGNERRVRGAGRALQATAEEAPTAETSPPSETRGGAARGKRKGGRPRRGGSKQARNSRRASAKGSTASGSAASAGPLAGTDTAGASADTATASADTATASSDTASSADIASTTTLPRTAGYSGAAGGREVKSSVVGGQRLPITRGAASRLSFLMRPSRVDLFVEGTWVAELEWGRRDSAAGSHNATMSDNEAEVATQAPAAPRGSQAGGSRRVGGLQQTRASIRFPKETKLFWAWRQCTASQHAAAGAAAGATAAAHGYPRYECLSDRTQQPQTDRGGGRAAGRGRRAWSVCGV